MAEGVWRLIARVGLAQVPAMAISAAACLIGTKTLARIDGRALADLLV